MTPGLVRGLLVFCVGIVPSSRYGREVVNALTTEAIAIGLAHFFAAFFAFHGADYNGLRNE